MGCGGVFLLRSQAGGLVLRGGFKCVVGLKLGLENMVHSKKLLFYV